jgi:hypothetical protein
MWIKTGVGGQAGILPGNAGPREMAWHFFAI